ncbi:type II toxin-antitoxin system HicB family antitoxin [Blautia schinkii]|nr:type II toxin-antitoxin system HicB family antitoxin [Blautia schinkii]
MLSAYPACFFKEKDSYSVIFPDLNYLSTCGETLHEALEMAVECLAGYLYTCKREGEEVSEPSEIDKIDIKALRNELEIEASQAFINIVTVDVIEYAKSHFERSVKKTLSIPEWLNTAAMEKNINFSQVLQEALKERLHVS